MRIYLDEDIAQPLLVKLLGESGHDVLSPDDVAMRGKPDPVQLGFAIRHQRVLITANHRDFEYSHDLVLASGGHHSGILAIRKDNDPSRDMLLRAIVRTIRRVTESLVVLDDICQALNQWR